MNLNEHLFTQAKGIIPGGVDSPVRAFGGVGGTPGTPRVHHPGCRNAATPQEKQTKRCDRT